MIYDYLKLCYVYVAIEEIIIIIMHELPVSPVEYSYFTRKIK
jgi:hypothetical protein